MILVLRSGKSGTEKLEVTKESLKLPFLHLSGEGWTRDRPETGRRGRESLALDQLRAVHILSNLSVPCIPGYNTQDAGFFENTDVTPACEYK